MRQLTIFLTLFLLVGASACGETENKETTLSTTQPDSVTTEKVPVYPTAEVLVRDVSRPIRFTGRVVPLQEAVLSSQVPGIVQPTDKLLQKGKYYAKDEIVVQIDNEQLRLGLRAERSQLKSAIVRLLSDLSMDYPTEYPAWKKFTDAIQPDTELPPLPTGGSEQLAYFISARDIQAKYYGIQAQEALLDDYTVRAPFSGRLTMAAVDPGSYVQPGAPLAKISRTDTYEVEAAIPASAMDQVKVGLQLQLKSRNLGKTYSGTINRFGTEIDHETQSIIAYVRVSDEELRSGMYLEAELQGPMIDKVAVLPKEALTRDNSVLVISPEKVVQAKPVEVVLIESDQVFLRGLSNGDRVIIRQVQGTITGTRAEYALR